MSREEGVSAGPVQRARGRGTRTCGSQVRGRRASVCVSAMEVVHVLLLLLLLTACAAGGLCAAEGLCAWGSWAGVLTALAVGALMCRELWTRAWNGEETLPSAGRSVLITGCDSGFGHAFALRLSRLGVHVFAGVLDIDGPGAQSLKKQEPKGITVLHMDVTNSEHIARAKEQIKKQLGDKGLWGLVNNAGLLLCPVNVELQSTSCFQRLMAVNFLSAVAVTQAFLPLIRRAKGRVVSMSSLAGVMPMLRFSAYAASKAALTSFSRILRLEMLQWGVHVALVQPSGFKTKIFGSTEDVSQYKQELLSHTPPEVLQDYGPDYIFQLPSSLTFMSHNAEQDLSPVLECLEHALLSRRPKALYAPGRGAWLLPFLYKHLPSAAFDALSLRFVNDTCLPSALQNGRKQT